jgi:hypothetical protein
MEFFFYYDNLIHLFIIILLFTILVPLVIAFKWIILRNNDILVLLWQSYTSVEHYLTVYHSSATLWLLYASYGFQTVVLWWTCRLLVYYRKLLWSGGIITGTEVTGQRDNISESRIYNKHVSNQLLFQIKKFIYLRKIKMRLGLKLKKNKFIKCFLLFNSKT